MFAAFGGRGGSAPSKYAPARCRISTYDRDMNAAQAEVNRNDGRSRHYQPAVRLLTDKRS